MRYSTETSAPATEIIARARRSFGSQGAGLRLKRVGMLDVAFDSPAGQIAVTIEPRGGANTVIIETREMDAEVRSFIRSLPRRSLLGQVLHRLRSKMAPRERP